MPTPRSALATHLMDDDFDIAVSRRMQVDHGFAQSLQLLWGGLDTPPVVPIFINAVAQPGIPRLRRCRQLGEAIGRFLDGCRGRTLLIGSGGLSHEPPVPTLAHPDAAVRERITVKREPTAGRARREDRSASRPPGRALAAGDSSMKPLNPEWDRRWMDALDRASSTPSRALERGQHRARGRPVGARVEDLAHRARRTARGARPLQHRCATTARFPN